MTEESTNRPPLDLADVPLDQLRRQAPRAVRGVEDRIADGPAAPVRPRVSAFQSSI